MRYLLVLCCFAAFAQDLRLRYALPPEPSVVVAKGITYRTIGERKLQFDLYRPAGAASVPVVIFLNGIGSDDLKRWPIYQDWGAVVTSQGLAGHHYGFEIGQRGGRFPRTAGLSAFECTRASGRPGSRLALGVFGQCSRWSADCNGCPAQGTPRRVIYYGSGEVKDFRPDLPVLYVRAGTDNVGLNRASMRPRLAHSLPMLRLQW